MISENLTDADTVDDMAGPNEVDRALVRDGVLTGADPSGVAGQLGGSCCDPRSAPAPRQPFDLL